MLNLLDRTPFQAWGEGGLLIFKGLGGGEGTLYTSPPENEPQDPYFLPTPGRQCKPTYREQHVLLVLVDSLLVWHWVSVLDDAHALSGQDGLVNLECGGVDDCDPDVSRDLVSN